MRALVVLAAAVALARLATAQTFDVDVFESVELGCCPRAMVV